MPIPVTVRPYKEPRLNGATLVVSVPHAGLANMLLTDFLLEQGRMDQVAAVDCEAFPPFAMVHRGKARYPARIHADAAGRLVVLRCDFAPPALLAKPIAAAVLDWAATQGLARVVVADVVHLGQPGVEEEVQATPAEGADAAADEPELPRAWFVASDDGGRRQAQGAGLREFGEGVLEGVSAALLLEARFRRVPVLGLFTERRDLVDDARGAHVLAHALRKVVPDLAIDVSLLEERVAEVESAVRQAREAAEQALLRMRGAEGQAATTVPMYG